MAEIAVKGKKSVLVVGLDPALIDFSKPGYPPGMNTEKVLAGMKASEEELTRLGMALAVLKKLYGYE